MSKLDNYAKAKSTLAAVRTAMEWRCQFAGTCPSSIRAFFYSDDVHGGSPNGPLNMGAEPFRLFLEALDNTMPQAVRQEVIRLAHAELEEARVAAEEEAREVLGQVARSDT